LPGIQTGRVAVNCNEHFVAALALCGLTIACARPVVTHAETPDATGNRGRAQALVQDAREWWRAGTARLAEFWDESPERSTAGRPEWLREIATDDAPGRPAFDNTHLFLQQDRSDGTELMTLRCPLDRRGNLRTYAGAGLNRTVYFFDDAAPGPSMLSRRNRRESLGAAAELGAELRLGARMRLNADLRWADLDERASVLRTDHGPVVADPLMLGVRLGYRFR
jgi:hypothetical protein